MTRCIGWANYLMRMSIRQPDPSLSFPATAWTLEVFAFRRLTEATVGSIVLPIMFASDLERAILEALAYSDIFEYPLRLDELHRYLPMRADIKQISGVLESLLNGRVGQRGGFYFLAGSEEIVDIRRQREARSRSLLPLALSFGRALGFLPFVRMVALTGSLAVMNVSKAADFDYMLVTVRGRVWTARAFTLAFNRFTRLFGHTLCPNLVVSENALKWPLHDLYSARELCQMIPATGMDVYDRLIKANEWAKEFLPNAWQTSEVSESSEVSTSILQRTLEPPLRGKLGDKLESWEMGRKIARFSEQEGFGEETVFNAEVCQGNFHHHRKWTHAAYQHRLNNLSIDSPLPLALSGVATQTKRGEGLGVRVS